MTKTFTVPQVPGSKRSSKTRDYTHAVIAKFDSDRYAAELDKRLAEIRTSKINRSDFDYYTLCANAVVGETVYSTRGYTVKQEQADEARVVLARKGQTFEAYVKFLCDEEVEQTADVLRRKTGQWSVQTWSMSEVNARRAAATLSSEIAKGYGYLTDIQVVPVVEV